MAQTADLPGRWTYQHRQQCDRAGYPAVHDRPKNWMFSTSVGGAKANANLYSLVMTCRANDINPYYYFRLLFIELPKRSLADDMSDLMPWNIDLSSVD